jgi:GNAT superfamily N-acetyltransferase
VSATSPGPDQGYRVRRLGPDDGGVLALLSRDDADFDIEGRGGGRTPLSAAAARAYLGDAHVLFWVAFDGKAEDQAVGFLSAIVVPLRQNAGRELLLYETGVRASWRRRGVGSALVGTMRAWMAENAVSEAWVLADNEEAAAFYAHVGFHLPDGMARYMVFGSDDQKDPVPD